jgi:hypothetical protein
LHELGADEAKIAVGVNEIENIFQDIKPLALGEHDKAAGLKAASSLPHHWPSASSA